MKVDLCSVPIIINSFNQPTYLKNMISQLSSRGYKNIIILDQNSTSKTLNELLDVYEKTYTVIRLKHNNGPHWFFTSGLALNFPDWFAYTDPDLQFQDDLHETFIGDMIDVAKKHNATKVGLALDIESPEIISFPINIGGKDYTTITWERQFWEKKVDDNNFDIYEAPVDTTFAVYNMREFSQYVKEFKNVKLFDCMSTPNSFRIAGKFKSTHLPWMKNSCIPKEELDFYINNRCNIHDY